jgi:hypothetical protein
VIAGQEPENPLENAALGPSVEALMDDRSLDATLEKPAYCETGRPISGEHVV